MNREAKIFNRMLSLAGLAFSEGVEIDHPFAPAAHNVIEDVKQQLAVGGVRTSRMGWWFNTEIITLYRSYDEVPVPPSVLRLDVLDAGDHADIVRRGDRLFDRVNQTYRIGKDVRALVVVDMPLDDTPIAFQMAVEAECCRRFAVAPLSSPGQAAAFQAEFNAAFQQLEQEDDAQKPANVISDGEWNHVFKGGCHARRRR